MKLFETFWRTGLLAIMALALFVGGLVAADWVQERGQVVESPLKGVKPYIVVFKQKLCEPDFPIFVAAENKGKQALKSFSFELEATQPGHSTNLVSMSVGPFVDDLIIKPGEILGSCWAVPMLDPLQPGQKARSLHWRVRLTDATWETKK